MDLHHLARVITAVNPDVAAVISRSTGFTVTPNYEKVPTYSNFPIDCQVQALTYTDLMQIDGLNIQGVRRALYVEGAVASIIRGKRLGGDLITFSPGTLPEGDTWLVVHVLESWPDWSKFVITLQEP